MSTQSLNQGLKFAEDATFSEFYNPIPAVDFSIILAHLNARKDNLTNFEDTNAIDSLAELTIGFVESLQEKYPNIVINVEPGDLGTVGLIYMLMWFDRFSLNLAISAGTSINCLVLNTCLEVNTLIPKAIQKLSDHDMPNMSIYRNGTETICSYLQMLRIFDVYIENVLDGKNLLRLMKNTSDEFFLECTQQIEIASRTLRTMSNQYFLLPSSIA